jgi:hypothetical protein
VKKNVYKYIPNRVKRISGVMIWMKEQRSKRQTGGKEKRAQLVTKLPLYKHAHRHIKEQSPVTKLHLHACSHSAEKK